MKKIMYYIIRNKIKVLICLVTFLLVIVGYVYLKNKNSLKFELKGESIIKLEYNEEYKEKGFKVTLKGEDLSDKVEVRSNVDNQKLGAYEIEYVIKIDGKEKKIIRKVEVVDTKGPEITLKGKSFACGFDSYQEEGYTAIDNFDGDVTSKVIVEKEKDKIIYKVTDSHNNKTVVERVLTEKDAVKPDIRLIGGQTIYVKLNQNYTELGVEVTDNCDKNLSSKVEIKSNVDITKLGTYEVTYEVVDKAGNKSMINRNVIVVKTLPNNQNGVTNKTGAVYLTFDDGPSQTITPALLDILKAKNVKATFFVIHRDNLSHLIKRAHDEGHVIALHSYTHNYQKIYANDQAFFDDLNKISKEVEEITGIKSYILRFPGGGSNTISRRYNKGIMSRLTRDVIAKGYRYYDWNVSSGDAGNAKTKQDVYKNVTSGLVKNRDNIVLMHDFSNNYKTLNAVSDIIDFARNNGYVFKTIDETTPMVRHKVAN